MSVGGKVLIAAPVHVVLTDALEGAGYTLERASDIKQADAAALIQDCVGIITSTKLMLDRALIDAAPGLRWIGRMGSGMEVVDVAYAASKGIACLSSPEGNCNAVAEHALGLLLGITKRIAHSAGEVKRGLWLREENRGMELEGKTIGLIGFGHTGRAFARKLSTMDMRILAYDKAPLTNTPGYVSPCENLEPILAEAEILSFHVQIAPDTHHYLNRDFVARMNRPFILLNTSRGSVVDAAALMEGMRSGKITGAGIDVWEEEPLSRMSAAKRALLEEVMRHPTAIVTPHIAGYTREALYKMSEVLRDKILGL